MKNAIILGFAWSLVATGVVNSATTIVSYQVSASTDDGFAWSDTEQDIISAYLKIGDERAYPLPYQMSAMRFTDINIPRSAKIIESRLKLYSINTDYRDQIYGVIQAEFSDNPTDFSDRFISDAILTTAYVAWDHKTAWSPDTQYVSQDISSVLQEVINRPGFNNSNSIAIYYNTRDLSGKGRSFASYEYNPSSAAILDITYEVFSITGTVATMSGTPISDVVITTDGNIEETITDSNGYYQLLVPPGWSGTVMSNKIDWGFSPASRSYSNVNSNQLNQDYIAFQPLISGNITDGDTGIEGVMVSADNGGGSDTTDATGFYEIIVPYQWSGTVTPNKTDWGFSPAYRVYSGVISDQINQDYIIFQPYISGYIKDANGLAIENVQVSANNGGWGDTTDVTGYYEIALPYDWSGTVTPSKNGWVFDPWRQSYSNVTADIVDQDYTAFELTYGGGTGTETDPYIIYEPNHLMAIGVHPEDWDEHFLMTDDIVLKDYQGNAFNLIGTMQFQYPAGIALVADDGTIYFIDRSAKKICRVNIDGSGLEDVITGLTEPFNLVLDIEERKLYWDDTTDNKIQRANIDGTLIEDVVSEMSITSIALDSVHNKIYWVSDAIKRANLDGSDVEYLVPDVTGSTDITLDLVNEKLYWSDGGDENIKRANLDGSSVETLIEGLSLPKGIILDLVNSKIYWIDYESKKIQRSNLDGSGVEDVVTQGMEYPVCMNIDQDSNSIFWTDKKYIKRVNLDENSQEYVLSNFFSGVFDGNGHTISNLIYTATDTDRVGLFGAVRDPNAVIRNVNIVEPNILSQGEDALACSPLVGVLYDGAILNCKVEGGQVKGEVSVASIAGQSSGIISNCQSTCTVYGKRQVGGLVGFNLSGTILSSSFSGKVEATIYMTGGLAGINSDGVIEDSFSTGTVTALGYAGGLVGYNTEGEIYDSYAICDVNGTSSKVGGLIGQGWYGKIERCFAECNVNSQDQVGGLCGYLYHTGVINSYATGSVAGQSNVGGLVGYCSPAGLLNCYSTAYVSGESNTGGLVGYFSNYYATNCFWDIESSGQISSSVGTGKTTQQMKQIETFVSWSCDKIWTINEGIDYPRLHWEQKEGVPLIPYSYWGQTGEPNDPIQIYTGQQLLNLGFMPCEWDKHFILLNDIDIQEQGAFIGDHSSYFIPFTGVFDGNNHSISNLRIDNTYSSFNGLFGHIKDPNAVVKDLTLLNPSIVGRDRVGSLVGYLEDGIVSNCHVSKGHVAGRDYVGGLIGESNEPLQGLTSDAQVIGSRYIGGLLGYMSGGKIEDCNTSGNISNGSYAGGLVGYCDGEIINCTSGCDVAGSSYTGGLAGSIGGANPGSITNCQATGNVTGNNPAGGLVGYSSGNISDSRATGSVIGGNYIGGLVGINRGQIATCSAEGDVNSVGTSSYVGGFVGQNSGTISDCFATGDVEGYHEVGGMAGLNWDGDIRNCHSEGNVIGNNHVGGLIGLHFEAYASNNYALGHVSGNDRVGGLIGQITNHHGNTNVIDCCAKGNVQGNEGIGGLVGFSYKGYEGRIYITRCCAWGEVTGNTLVGGLVGLTDDYPGNFISKCYSIGNVNLTSDYGGGLIGENNGTVSYCYARGNVIGSAASQYIGGLIGYNDGMTSYSYAAGNVVGSTNNVGGLIGDLNHDPISYCYWDITTGGLDNGFGTPKTTEEMQLKDTFIGSGWNFITVWSICEGISYPRLQWHIPSADFTCPYGVTMVDFAILAQAWQSTPTDAHWDSTCDLDGNEHIGAGDLAITCNQWLEGM